MPVGDAKAYENKGNDPNYHNTGSRKTPDYPTTQFGSEETGGRRAVKKPMNNLNKVHSPGHLGTREPSNQKRSFRP